MIKKLLYATLYCFAVLAISCSQEGEDNFDFTMNQTPLRLAAMSPGVHTVELTANMDWEVTISEPWLKVDPMSGKGNCTILISAEDNNTLFWRTATVSVVVNHKTHLAKEVQVTQYGLEETLPVPAGPIFGKDQNDFPEVEIELYLDPIARADSYVWYCDGLFLDETTLPEIAVSDIGNHAYTVTGKNAVGEGTPSPEKRTKILVWPLPYDAGIIAGEANNLSACPDEFVEMTIDPIEYTEYYQWYQDGIAIAGATTTVYEATASGTYNVAGVSRFGEGAWSPDKVVEIIECPFIYKLLGEWTVNEYAYTDAWYKISHKLEISFVNATTVEIKKWAPYSGDFPIRATVNNAARTIALGGRQEMIPTLNASYTTWICPMQNNATACNGWALTFPAATVAVSATSYTVQIIGAGTYNPTVDGAPRRGSYGIVGATGTTCAGSFCYCAGTFWTKNLSRGNSVSAQPATSIPFFIEKPVELQPCE